tara:strand:+ start:728 stop:904 length:177 start_codon:yes stop_codon:yes gene_type:complete
MTYIIRKEWANQRVAGFKPFEDFTQQEIKNLIPALRDRYFIEDKPKKKKKDDSFEGKI